MTEYGLAYLRAPIVEGEAASTAQLSTVAQWIEEHMASDGPVLVHCREGRGRSAMIAVAALMQLGYPLADAYKMAVRAHPGVAMNGRQQEALARFQRCRVTGAGS